MQECSNKIVWDLELCKNIHLLQDAEQIFLYGAGGKGRDILGWLQDAGIAVDKFCDIDEKKWGGSIDDVELFLFKVEKMEDILDKISEFVGADRLPNIDANVAEQKWYSLAYAQMRKEIQLPEQYVNHYYQGNSKMDHFYSQEEKRSFLNQWKENIKGLH